MKAAPFRYERPRQLGRTLTLVRDPEARALAGGQSLVPVMAMRLARPHVLVDLAGVEGLDQIERRDDEVITGAMVRQRTLERWPGLAAELPLVAAALPFVGHREIRNRGTVGGSVAHADPAAELGLVAATLRARIEAHCLDGSRDIAADEFVTGPFQTTLAQGELLTAIRWPLAQPGDGFSFEEVARRHGDFALCGVAVHVRRRDPGATSSLRLWPSCWSRKCKGDVRLGSRHAPRLCWWRRRAYGRRGELAQYNNHRCSFARRGRCAGRDLEWPLRLMR